MKMGKGIPLSDQDRIPWLCNLHDILLRDVSSGQHVVLACSALKKMYRDILIRGKDGAALKHEESGEKERLAEVQLLVVHLRGSFEVISGRLLKRKGHFMPPELLQSQFETLEPPAAPENFIQVSVDSSLSEVIATVMETLKMKSESFLISGPQQN
ncbi:PREDICTED: probable gluconokinase [Galeopterus variegatus]|uniref:gluconokinase n=1 Tax=Galeopterus variegatus TaxID=482537 RepID=A0ABM0QFY2_GALVR|nr:PREDICTED: probable gluconokinase [Galeopterus variegatus]XP_008567273.1 PREDICTED: probable gluconokinase [Galeopterus variegatus]